jgi:purine nucleosidase
MVGWDISRTHAVFGSEDIAALRKIGTSLAHFCIDIQKDVEQFARTTTQLDGFDLPDPIAMAIALDPSVATSSRRCFVAIETTSTLCRGQSVVDHLQLMGREPNTEVVREASREKFVQMLSDAVRRT